MDDPHDNIEGIPQRPAIPKEVEWCDKCQDVMEVCSCGRDYPPGAPLILLMMASLVVALIAAVCALLAFIT